MTTLRHGWKVLVFAVAAVGAASARADEFVLVANLPRSAVVLAKSEVRDLFTGKRKQWPGNSTVQLVLASEGAPEIAWLAKAFFGISPTMLMSKIKQQVFRGDLVRPIVTTSEAQTIERIGAVAGAIGIVSAATVKSLPAGVTIIKVVN